MKRTAQDLTAEELDFLAERHIATLTTLRRTGHPHVVAIAFGFDPSEGLVRIICNDGGQKVLNVERDGRAAVSQVDGPRWLTLEGSAVVTRDPENVAKALAAFERRYRPASENPQRVAIEITVDRVLGRA